MVKAPGSSRFCEMVPYLHYSGFIVHADELVGIDGIPNFNGWIVDNSKFKPWYLTHQLEPEESLKSEMSMFVNFQDIVQIEPTPRKLKYLFIWLCDKMSGCLNFNFDLLFF